ncbi:hypothetical protein PTKIN_Ptkin13bG0298400 [Pterospermum kingtungense]
MKNPNGAPRKVKMEPLEAEDCAQDSRTRTSGSKMKSVRPEPSTGLPLVPKKEHGSQLNVNLARLETDSLRRYLRHYKIEGIGSDSSREQMLNAVQQHFASQPPPDEQQVIPEFVDAARRFNT